jgi:hypothetical protein
MFSLPFITTMFTLAYLLLSIQLFAVDIALLRTYLCEMAVIN